MTDYSDRQQGGRNNLRLLREKLGLTQVEFADYLGIADRTVRRCESEGKEIQLSFAQWHRLHNLVWFRLGIDLTKDLPAVKLSEFNLGEILAACEKKNPEKG